MDLFLFIAGAKFHHCTTPVGIIWYLCIGKNPGLQIPGVGSSNLVIIGLE